MNARSQIFDLTCEKRQMEEAVLSIFHSVIFQRCQGKFTYHESGGSDKYTVGTLGYEDVDCDYIEHTYVRTYSPQLDARLREEVAAFAAALQQQALATESAGAGPGAAGGQVSLEFFQRRRRWPFPEDCIPWEVWTVRADLVRFTGENERQYWFDHVGEVLSEKVRYITEVMNRHEYLPTVPERADLDLVFDTSFADVQPYLFKVSHATSDLNCQTMGTTVRRLIRDTLSI